MNPKPLDLEEIWNIIYNVFLEHYEERVCDVSNVDLKTFICPKCGNVVLLPKMCYCDNLLEKLKQKKKEIKQRIREACEFYLRYRDKPELLVKECFNLDLSTEEWEVIKFYCEEVLDKLENSFYNDEEVISQYNEWLFKLAFNLDEVKGK